MRKTSSAAQRRAQNRATRNRLTPRGTLSNDTLKMGSHVRQTYTYRTLGRKKTVVTEAPTDKLLSDLRYDERLAKGYLSVAKARAAALTAKRYNTSRLRWFKRDFLAGDIASEKAVAAQAKLNLLQHAAKRRELERQLKKTHRSKLARMRRSKGPNLP